MKQNFRFGIILRLAGIAAICALHLTIYAQNTPLYRYQTNSGNGAYAATDEHRQMFLKHPANKNPQSPKAYTELGAVGYVHTTKTAGTVPLLTLMKPTSLGDQYYYSATFDDVLTQQEADNKWSVGDYNKGITAYVSKTAGAGKIAVYRYRQPSGKSWIYAFGEAENNLLKTSKSLKFEKIAFYIWSKPALEKDDNGGQPKSPSGTKFDYSLRTAIYPLGKNAKTIDTSGKYVWMKEKIVLKKAEAVSCAADSCEFNLGFLVTRNIADDKATYAYITSPAISVGNTLQFAPNKKTAEAIFPVKLKIGENKVRASVDPFKKTAEADETNNDVEVTIIVQ